MPHDDEHDDRSLPSKAFGWQGVRRWFFGRREYAHPALRWTAMPLFRLAWLPYSIDVLAYSFRNTWLSVSFITLFALSLLATVINMLMLRRKREQPSSEIQQTAHLP